ncbi:MAG: hypothetical protein E2O39_04005 [Planctomycetota bacterium]|nr:MAG: hypothetical protein E2O39_04005 [Planctomycetota bacterium]
MKSNDRTEQEAPRRRGCFGCLFTGLLGCVAFLVGSLTAAILFAPQLLGDLVAAGLERAVNREIDGELRIDTLELAWTDRQRADVLLLDPAGREVLVVAAELPSLFSLLGIDESSARFDLHVHRAEIVVGDDGITNLERSLARDGAKLDYEGWTTDFRWDRSGLNGAPFRLRLHGDELTWEDRRFPGPVARFENLELTIASERSRSLLLTGSVELPGEPAGRVAFHCVLDRAAGRGWSGIDAELHGSALPTAALDLVAGAGGRLLAALGPAIDVELEVSGDMDEGAPLLARVGHAGGGDMEVNLAGRLRRGVLTAEADDAGLRAHLAVPERLCEDLLLPLLPAGVELRREDPSAVWTVTARRFAIPLPIVSEGPFIEGFAVDAKLLPGTDLRLVEAGGAYTELQNLGARLSIAPDTLPTLELHADVLVADGDGQRPSRAFVALEGWAFLDSLVASPAAPGRQPSTMAIEVEAPVLPARLFDLFLGRAGLFEEAFGPALHLSLRLPARNAEGASLDLVVVSPQASFQWHGVVAGGLVTSGPGGLRARVPLGTELGRLVAERFVPWLRPVTGAGGDAMAELIVDDLVVSTWDEPATISGRARLDFERLEYRYAGGLESLVEGSSARARTDPPEPVAFTIAAGTVTYDGVAVALGGRPCTVSGTLDLATDRIDLEILAPMGIFARGIGLDPAVADVLDPGLEVPIQISGTAAEPRVSIGMQAFTSLLRGGLEGLLGSTGGRLLRHAFGDGSPESGGGDVGDR